jgi:hypothetical protein
METEDIFSLIGAFALPIAVFALILIFLIPGYQFNDSQFLVNDTNISINSSWIISELNNTGDQNLSTYVQGNMSSETTTTYTPTNGSALSFDGNGDYINLGTDSSLNLVNSFTISAWFKTNTISGDHGIVSKMYDASSSPYNLILTTNDLRFETTNSTGGTSIYSYNTILTGNWYHVVATYNGTTSSLYLNGSFVTSASKIGPLVSGSKAAVIGGHQPAVVPTWSFNGVIDEVLIFNRSLNSTEVEQLYNSGIGLYTNTSVAPFNSGLVSAWHFDEGSGTRAVDITGRNNGTLVGGTSWVDGKVPHNIVTQVLGAIGLMPWVSATNFISTDFSLQWIGNALKNPWNTISTLGNSTNRWNVHLNNVTMNGTQGWSGNCVNSSILNGIIVGCND